MKISICTVPEHEENPYLEQAKPLGEFPCSWGPRTVVVDKVTQKDVEFLPPFGFRQKRDFSPN
jgi:hypothetical protein